MSAPTLTHLSVDAETCPGGLAVWGTVEALFDTSRPSRQEGFERGIHVHGRMREGGRKHINTTHSSVDVRNLPFEGFKIIHISRDLAIYFVVLSSIHNSGVLSPYAEKELAALPQAAEGLNACAARATSTFLSRLTPLELEVVDFLVDLNARRHVVRPRREIDISLDNLRNGVQLWGSNMAMI